MHLFRLRAIESLRLLFDRVDFSPTKHQAIAAMYSVASQLIDKLKLLILKIHLTYSIFKYRNYPKPYSRVT